MSELSHSADALLVRGCKEDGCPGRHSALGWCRKHLMRWYRHGSPLVTLRARRETLSYSGMHTRLQRLLGPASAHRCSWCPEPAADWAYTGGDPEEVTRGGRTWSLDPARYLAACTSCHVRSDSGHPVRRHLADALLVRTSS